MNSNSDSDLDFLDEIPSVQTESLETLKQQLWQKTGENDILRRRLVEAEQEKQHGISALVEQHMRGKAELEARIKRLQQQIEKERVQTQFSAAELRMSRLGAGNAGRGSTIVDAPRPKRAADAFGDGFELKKPKLAPQPRAQPAPGTAPSSASGRGSGSGAPSAQGQHAPGQLPSLHPLPKPNEKAEVLSFLVEHRCPGFEMGTLQILYELEHNGRSVGRLLGDSESLESFAASLCDQLQQHVDNTEVCVLMLSLLYDLFLQAGTRFDISKQTYCTVVTRVLQCCTEWSRSIELFPELDKLGPLSLISVPSTWALVAVLYSLDTLLASGWQLSLPFDLVKRLLVSQSPEVCNSVLVLLANNARCEGGDEALIELAGMLCFQMPANFALTPALLFSGMSGVQGVTAPRVFSRPLYSLREARLAYNATELASITAYCQWRRTVGIEQLQVSIIKLAQELVPMLAETAKYDAKDADKRERGPPVRHVPMAAPNYEDASARRSLEDDETAVSITQLVQDIDGLVLMLLVGAIDGYALRKSDVVIHAVYYFWVRDYTSLKESLGAVENDLAELCLCLSKIVYECEQAELEDDAQFSKACDYLNTSEQSRQLLQVFSSSVEVDHVFQLFAPGCAR